MDSSEKNQELATASSSSNNDVQKEENDQVARNLQHTERNRWDQIWPVLACGAGLFSDGYLNNVSAPALDATAMDKLMLTELNLGHRFCQHHVGPAVSRTVRWQSCITKCLLHRLRWHCPGPARLWLPL